MCVCVLAGVGQPLVLLPVTPPLGFSMSVMEKSLQELACVCTYPIWGLGPTVGLDSWGEGFLIF